MPQQMPDELRHAFRALLRAATYLPDSAARTYIHSYAVNRFRSVADKINSKSGDAAEELIARYHGNKRIAKVWQASRQVERAGQGSLAELQKVLYLTYGRAGKRRRELIQQFLKPEEESFPEDQAALEELIQRSAGTEGHSQKTNKKLQSFIKSQKYNHPADTRRSKVRNLNPKIPENNLWGRPVPLKRQANIKRKYWADTLERLLPPVPRHEWDRLRDLATGAIPIENLPLRRSRPLEQPPDTQLWKYFTVPTSRHNLVMEGMEVEEDNIITHWGTATKANTRGMKTLTPRFMRRLYASIWGMTPTMTQDEVTNEWTTKWGGARSAALTGQITAPSAKDLEFFEGAVKSNNAKTNDEKRQERFKRKILPEHKPPPREALGNEGYTQGVAPVI
jgi:hypothetical protein